MLIQPTLERLYKMRLNGMAEAFRKQLEDPHAAELSFEERFGMLVVDDFAMNPMTESERCDFLEICNDRFDLL